MARAPSWVSEPKRLSGVWSAYRQVDPRWPPLYRSSGEPRPTQESGRWHRQGEEYVQYMSLEPAGAWCELVRREEIRDHDRRSAVRRNLWRITVQEHDIADLSGFDTFEECGLDPGIAVGPRAKAQALGAELREAGYRGVLAPSAALPGAVNLAVFGERYEIEIATGTEHPGNPDPALWFPALLIAPAAHPPAQALSRTCYRGEKHRGFAAWRKSKGSRNLHLR